MNLHYSNLFLPRLLLSLCLSGCIVLSLTACSIPVPPSPATNLKACYYNSRIAPNNSYAEYLKARYSVANGEIKAALTALTQAVSADPDSVYLRLALASLCLEDGQVENAHKLLLETLAVNPDSVDAQLLLADLLYNRNLNADRVRAVLMFRKILQQHPDMEELYLHLSRLLTSDNDYAQALIVVNKLLERQPDNSRALLLRGKLYQLDGDLDNAEKDYRQVIKLSPELSRGYLYLGRLLEEKKKQPEEALLIYQQAAEQSEYPASFNQLRVTLLMQLERDDEALVVLQKLAQQYPDDFETQSKIGFIRLKQHKWQQAEHAFSLAVTQEPIGQLYYWLGYALEQQQRWADAVVAYRHVDEPPLLQRQAMEHLAYVEAQNGDFSSAIITLEKLIQQCDANDLDVVLDDHAVDERIAIEDGAKVTRCRPVLYLQLALYYQYNNQPNEVLLALQRGVKSYPNSAELFFASGVYYSQYGQQQQMVKSMLQTLKLDENHSGALNYLAYTYAENGTNLKTALQMAQQAVKLSEDNGAYLDTLGWVYYKLGRYDQALKQLQLAVVANAHDLMIQEHLADTYLALGDMVQAQEVYQHILLKTPDNKQLQLKVEALSK